MHQKSCVFKKSLMKCVLLNTILLINLVLFSYTPLTGITSIHTYAKLRTSIDSSVTGALVSPGVFHEPIFINSSNDFLNQAQTEGWAGDGTSNNPYRIEGLEIRNGTAGYCIRIQNTQVHFIIINCFIFGANTSNGVGISLDNVANGTLVNNTCTNNTNGIDLFYSQNNSVINNTCTYNTADLHTNASGILLRHSDSNEVLNNTCCNNGNTGISLSYSDENQIVNNTCLSNGEVAGIYFWRADENQVANNTCNFNKEGFDLASGINNTFVNNTCANNLFSGIYLSYDAEQNSIRWNYFINNSQGAQDMGTGNIFDYNAFSDYLGVDADGDGIGDTPHPIPGLAGNSDPHPLMRYVISTPTSTPITTPVIPGFSIETIILALIAALAFSFVIRTQKRKQRI